MNEYINQIALLIRKVHLVIQAYKWSKVARRAIHERDTIMAEIAINKFDELNSMI